MVLNTTGEAVLASRHQMGLFFQPQAEAHRSRRQDRAINPQDLLILGIVATRATVQVLEVALEAQVRILDLGVQLLQNTEGMLKIRSTGRRAQLQL
jgi:hypothetical protein